MWHTKTKEEPRPQRNIATWKDAIPKGGTFHHSSNSHLFSDSFWGQFLTAPPWATAMYHQRQGWTAELHRFSFQLSNYNMIKWRPQEIQQIPCSYAAQDKKYSIFWYYKDISSLHHSFPDLKMVSHTVFELEFSNFWPLELPKTHPRHVEVPNKNTQENKRNLVFQLLHPSFSYISREQQNSHLCIIQLHKLHKSKASMPESQWEMSVVGGLSWSHVLPRRCM